LIGLKGWNDSSKISVVSTHPQFVLLQVHEANQADWYLGVVYGSPTHYLRRRLWNTLTMASQGIGGPLLVAGDFNAVLSQDETSNYNAFNSQRCSDFADWIQSEGLIDLGFSGPKLTWLRGMDTGMAKGARLDRALSNTAWRILFPEATVTHLPRISSDHTPLLLSLSGRMANKRMSTFKFQAAWFTHKGLAEVIKSSWDSKAHIMTNVSHLTDVLAKWNKDTFGNIFHKKKIVLARLGGIQTKLAISYHGGLAKLEKKLSDEYQEILYQEELLWFQRSREEWIISGDRNTAYYHAATTIRKARNKITSLRDDTGHWITDEKSLADHIRNYFAMLFTEDYGPHRRYERVGGFPSLSQTKWNFFNREVTIEEVHTALSDMSPFKAPGPDGLHAAFYQRMWNIVGENIFQMVKEAFVGGSLPPGLNDTTLVLIPKVQFPENVRQFRPISLCNVSYKIITKTITNRLKYILPDIVGPYQSSFVQGRQISDNILVFQEIMHTMRKQKGSTGYMAIKLDFEKAYDRLSWDFICSTLLDIGFAQNWVQLIMQCVQTPRLSILWNGQQLSHFLPERGIRQGDAMSPAIFVLCMEKLSQAISHSVSTGLWKGIKFAQDSPILSHLCFADDLVLYMIALIVSVTFLVSGLTIQNPKFISQIMWSLTLL